MNNIIYDLLPTGKANAVSTKDLCSYLGLSERLLRMQVESERKNGFPICSTTAGGYFKAENRAELLECERTLHSRSIGIQVALKPIRRALQEMEGQIDLGLI